jgi:serine/threonine protein kinase
LAFLHERRLVHRDIKPANILFVRGRPKLADIGLVTEVVATGVDITQVGTPGYMPPEGPGTPAADVFGLGRVLYVAATGRPAGEFPDVTGSVVDTVEAARLEALIEVLLKACEPIRRDRFQDARELGLGLRALGITVGP